MVIIIKTIIFDLSEVFLKGLLGTHEKISQRLGISLTSKDLLIPERDALFRGEINEDEYWKALIKRYGWNINVSDLRRMVRGNFEEITGTRKIIEKLKDKGFKLGLLSVHAKEWVEHCEKEFEYHKLFDSIMYSFEVAVCKPDKKAYELMLEKFGDKPEECLFIDDHDVNLEAAALIGIKTILFESAEQLRSDLKTMGIDLGTEDG